MKITPGQIKMIHTLLPSEVRKDTELKAQMVFQYTKDKERISTTQLKFKEADKLIKDLGSLVSEQAAQCNQMRRKIFGIFIHKMYYKEEAMHEWIVKYGLYHKPLMKHNYNELIRLVSQVEKVYKTFVEGLKKDK